MNDVFKGLPKELKDFALFDVVQRDILNIMKTECNHVKVASALKCKKCKFEEKIKARSEYLRGKGFKDYGQYLRWQQVMGIMREVKQIQDAKKTTKQKV